MSDKPVVALPINAWRYSRAQLFFWVTVIALAAADLLSKYLAFANIPFEKSVTIVPGLLDFKTLLNKGAVFGMGQGQKWVFVIATIAAIWFIVGLFARSRAKQHLLHAMLGLSLGGALGNLYDRIVHSAVRDFISITITVKEYSIWPWVFNIADVALVVGIGVLLIGWTFGWIELDHATPGTKPESCSCSGCGQQNE